ncbi:DUF4810 domain-containing protein [Trinickia fusca]|uniref:DUF4810 domain-containing protein n=1 Tax=Trinickia fusca TaxID=2419777 RepID=A0A494WYX1_9BURK|nr:DUF4810 domain-containing protein [Trinickia fusca]RKP43738.1 DUF4810 domain-containing protein [Trinickia fusca]
MTLTNIARSAGLPALAVTILVSGCAANNDTSLYQWDAYQPQVYEYFKGKTAPDAQIDALEKALQQIQSKNGNPPPGFHAHLGMLYASVGKGDQALQEFGEEKRLFPESSAYMDFLMKKPK